MGRMKERWCCLYCVEYSCILNKCMLHDVTVDDKYTNVCDNYEGVCNAMIVLIDFTN